MLGILKDKDQPYRFFYACALAGYCLIAFTYLFRENLNSFSPVLDFSLGIMPNLAGSFAIPFLFLVLLVDKLKNERLMYRWALFAWVTLSLFFGAILFEYFHLWFNLGGFHLPDVLASALGTLLSLLVFRFSIQKEAQKVTQAL